MNEMLVIIGLSLWLGLSAWIANSTPVIFGGGQPVDGNRVFRDGNRMLGDGKTIRGLVAGIICGTLTGLVQFLTAPSLLTLLQEYTVVTEGMENILMISFPSTIMLSVGALVGDLFGSFTKRRVNLRSGGPSPILDQLGFIIMGLIFAFPFIRPESQYVIVLILITFVVHWISNVVGYFLGFKEHPW